MASIQVGWMGRIAAAVLSVISVPGAATEPPTPAAAVLPDEVAWRADPRGPGIQVATLSGDPKAAGPYVLRVRMTEGARLLPHRHPDVRFVTVLTGTFHLGFGETFDAAAMRPYPAGSLIVIPAGTWHYGWVKSGESVTQDNGWGPTGTY